MNLISQKDGLSEWSYHNDYNPAHRQKMQHVDLVHRFEELNIEVELGFTAEQTAREVQRCLNCDVETAFTAAKCIECDACIDICPLSCLTIAADAEEDDAQAPSLRARGKSGPGALRLKTAPADQPPHVEGRRPVRPLRPLRGTMPHRGVGHAEVRSPY